MSKRNSLFQKSIRRQQREDSKERSRFIQETSQEPFVVDGKNMRMKNRKERRRG